MKKVSRRALLALLLAVVLLGGTALFAVRYAVSGDEWVTFAGSPHVYENGVLRSGEVQDYTGETLLRFSGERDYFDGAEASLHLLGDRSGNIDSPVLRRYASQFAGYNSLFGTYRTQKDPIKMTLTVRNSVQKAAYKALGGRKGTVAVYNYVNGEILCAVSAPSYDPDNVPNFEKDATGKYDGVYVNRFTGSVYVPGSIFKLVTTACALDTFGDSVLSRTFTCDGTLEVGADVVVCAGKHGEIALKEALAKSCNCAFGQLGIELGAERLEDYVNQMGLLESYNADGFQTEPARFHLQSATEIDTAWSAIGQHTVMINPYGYLRFLAQIATSSPVEPYFVEKIGSYKVQKRNFKLPIGENTASILTDFMANNVKTVYGAANFPDVAVCAKSGTAEVGEGQMPHATFAGFVKDERYPLAFIIVVENGGSGSETCSSIAGTVLQECINSMASVGK